MHEQNLYLAHHGIKGQKWGVRKYQNEDGSLTNAGKKRYSTRFSAEDIAATEKVGKSYRMADKYTAKKVKYAVDQAKSNAKERGAKLNKYEKRAVRIGAKSQAQKEVAEAYESYGKHKQAVRAMSASLTNKTLSSLNSEAGQRLKDTGRKFATSRTLNKQLNTATLYTPRGRATTLKAERFLSNFGVVGAIVRTHRDNKNLKTIGGDTKYWTTRYKRTYKKLKEQS